MVHVGIILDGNRRLAKRLGLNPWNGHEMGAKKVERLFTWCTELGVDELTLYALSVDNFHKRPSTELHFLFQIFRDSFTKLLNDPRLDENQIRVRFIGRLHLLPEDMQEIARKIEEKTKGYEQYIVNFAIAYGGREEVVDAVNKLITDVREGYINDDITPEMFSSYLYFQDEPDLIIRTGGDHRTSNFLIWQGNYAEWFFLDKFWPEFDKGDFKLVLEQYNNRQRRFGK